MALGSGLRSQEEESTKNITCCRIGYKIGCTGDWFMMKIPATIRCSNCQHTNTKTFLMNSYQHVLYFAVLIVPCM